MGRIITVIFTLETGWGTSRRRAVAHTSYDTGNSVT